MGKTWNFIFGKQKDQWINKNETFQKQQGKLQRKIKSKNQIECKERTK